MTGGDERGVTPVISAVLLVAVVTIIVAVVGGAVLSGVADDGPQGAFTDASITLTESEVTVSHLGGESVPLDDLSLVLRNDTTQTRYALSAANLSDASDAVFDPGETWTRTHEISINSGETLHAYLVHTPSGTVVAERHVPADALPE